MNEESLKRCPFCNGFARFHFKEFSYDCQQLVVKCNCCDAESTRGLFTQNHFQAGDIEIEQAKEHAANSWNRRAK